MTTKFISGMGPKSALIAPRPLPGTLVFKIIKKKSTAELGDSDLVSVYKSNANISRKH